MLRLFAVGGCARLRLILIGGNIVGNIHVARPGKIDLRLFARIYAFEILAVHDEDHNRHKDRHRNAHPGDLAVAVKYGVSAVEHKRVKQSRHAGRH